MANTEVAGADLRKMVEDFKKHGLPPDPVSFNEAASTLSEDQLRILGEITEFGEREKTVAVEGQEPTEGSEWWQVRDEARRIFQRAILAGLAWL